MDLTAQKALLWARAVWVLVTAWIVGCIAVVRSIEIVGGPTWVCGVQFFVVLMVMLGMWGIRGSYYKANWVKDVVTPRGYLKAHVLMAVLPVAASLAVMLVPGFSLGGVGLAFVAGVMLAMFPDGKPMEPHPIKV